MQTLCKTCVTTIYSVFFICALFNQMHRQYLTTRLFSLDVMNINCGSSIFHANIEWFFFGSLLKSYKKRMLFFLHQMENPLFFCFSFGSITNRIRIFEMFIKMLSYWKRDIEGMENPSRIESIKSIPYASNSIQKLNL